VNEIHGDEEAWNMCEQEESDKAAQNHQATQISNNTLANQIKRNKLNQQRIVPPSIMPINKTFKKGKASQNDIQESYEPTTKLNSVQSPRILVNTNKLI
jgi:hypothetical protein